MGTKLPPPISLNAGNIKLNFVSDVSNSVNDFFNFARLIALSPFAVVICAEVV